MKKIILLTFIIFSCGSHATEWVYVTDASKLKWQMTQSGVVYFRNLDHFDSKHAGCCYRYKLDTTTPGGSSLWSTMLAKMAAGLPITFGFSKIPESDADVQANTAIGVH